MTDIETRSPSRARIVTNWVLALLTIPAAVALVLSTYGAVMSTAGCSPGGCEHVPSEGQFTLLLYAPPVISAVAVVGSFFTATRRRGYLLPLIAWVLLIAVVGALLWGFQR